ncbi:MAG: hypothetical protein ACRD18_16790 [Terriglobia bacterium]
MMNPGVVIPLGCFAVVVIIVALVCFARIHDVETDAHWKIHQREIEHREAIRRLDEDLKRLRG